MTVLIDLIAGARPNFMKIAPIIRAIESRRSQGGALRYWLVHTGQHYDARMSGDFFEQLGIPEPNINLAAGSGTQAEQTAAIMIGYEALLSREPSALCLVADRSEEHTSELQSRRDLVCRLLLEKKKKSA